MTKQRQKFIIRLSLLLAVVALGLFSSDRTAQATSDTPWQTLNTTYAATTARYSSDINGGYRFTPNVNGQITQLSIQVGDGNSHLVELYNMSGTVLASANITGGGVYTWEAANITAVNVT